MNCTLFNHLNRNCGNVNIQHSATFSVISAIKSQWTLLTPHSIFFRNVKCIHNPIKRKRKTLISFLTCYELQFKNKRQSHTDGTTSCTTSVQPRAQHTVEWSSRRSCCRSPHPSVKGGWRCTCHSPSSPLDPRASFTPNDHLLSSSLCGIFVDWIMFYPEEEFFETMMCSRGKGGCTAQKRNI